jgi:hypothetical protein
MRKEIESWVLVARVRSTAQQMNLIYANILGPLPRPADVKMGYGCSEVQVSSIALPCRSTRNFVQETVPAAAPGTTTQPMALLEPVSGRHEVAYLRAAQAYMLISMPTGTSAIFGVFQAIRELPSPRHDYRAEIR